MPLRSWEESGILEREIALYRRLRERVRRVSVVTSGGPEEMEYQDHLGDIDILCNSGRVSPNLYSIKAHSIHGDVLRTADIYKTNQLDGAWTAILASRKHKKPAVVRAGYPWIRNFEAQTGRHLKASLLRLLERYSLRGAAHIVLATESMKKHYSEAYRIPTDGISVIPNYVDTTRFTPAAQTPKTPGRVCFVGRLTAVKNLHLLIEAAAGVDGCSLALVGTGPEASRLKTLASRRGVDVEFTGALPHADLPGQIHRSDVFVLPSQFEGHPKALIEAMACGAPALGTDVDGIREVIRDGETGLLCEPSVDGIRTALQRILSDADLRGKLGRAAAAEARSKYSLDGVVEKELSVYESVLMKQP